MYVCIYVYVCIYMYVYMYICVCIYMYIYVYVYAHMYIHMYTHTHIFLGGLRPPCAAHLLNPLLIAPILSVHLHLGDPLNNKERVSCCQTFYVTHGVGSVC